MCQIAVYLNDEKIMENVMLVTPTAEGIQLVTMFEPPQTVDASIRLIDLMKNKIFLVSDKAEEAKDE